MKPYEETCALFRIRENTKNEFVAIGSDGNILRWAASDGDEQLWLPIPAADGKVKFMTPMKGSAGEYMAVGTDGNIRRWKNTGGKEQAFRLVNPLPGDWWEIQESTQSEYVAVGTYGNILRWGRTGQKDQQFKFEPWRPTPKPDLETGGLAPGQIDDIPRLDSEGKDPPESSETYFIAETILPATVVNDGDFSEILAQVQQSPYYILRREQFWDRTGDRGFLREHAGKTKEEYKKVIRYLVTNTAGRSSESTLGIEFGVKGGYARSSTLGTISVELSTKITNQLKTKEYEEQQIEKETTYEFKRTLKVGPPFKIVGWSLVDRYSIMRIDRKLVAQWEVALDNTTKVDGFPKDVTAPYLI